MRNGHTEATTDLVRLAGLKECGVCCEIMKEDGTMMRTPQLWELAKEHNLTFITIRDLQDYMRIHEKHVKEIGKLKAAADRSSRWAEKMKIPRLGMIQPKNMTDRYRHDRISEQRRRKCSRASKRTRREWTGRSRKRKGC